MAEGKELHSGDLTIGEPLEWDIYDRKGRLLLRRGMIVLSEKQLNKIISYGAQRILENENGLETTSDEEKAEDLSPFANIDKAVKEISRVFSTMLKHVANKDSNILTRVYSLSSYLMELYDYDADAVLGALHLERRYPYAVIHPINTAMLSLVMANQLEYSIEQKLSLVSAALTANLGMFGLQQKLMTQREDLTPEQQDKINKHPISSAVLLKHWGINDKRWLEIVLQHHEKGDGTGYPRRLSGDKFIEEARILGIADRYHALLSPRKYRRGLLPTDALSLMFKGRGAEVDEDLTLLFVKELGIYPPGTFVRMKSGDTGIVTRRGEDRMYPIVKSILNNRGAKYPMPLVRDTNAQRLFEITGMCQSPRYEPNLRALWDYEV